MPRLLLALAALTPLILLEAQNNNVRGISDAITQSQNHALEVRKVELEERRLYLSTLQGSRITEEKARVLSLWILQNLKDYPQGKKAKHSEEDITLITETIASILKSN